MTYTPWTTRTVGIEMELITAGRNGGMLSTSSITSAIADDFSAAGLRRDRVRNHGGYGHSNGTTWDVKTDGSCGFEVASAALRLDDEGHNDELRAACATLTRIGKVDRRCGLHVHVDVSDFDRATFQRLLALWWRYEPFFFSLVAPSRAQNNFCGVMRSSEWTRNTGANWSPAHAQDALQANSDATMQRALGRMGFWHGRYQSMNLTPYALGGRVEFRLHHGTLDYAKIRNWTLWLTSLVNRAKRGLHVPEVRRQVAEPMPAGSAFATRGMNSRMVALGLGLVGTGSVFVADAMRDEMLTWANARRATFRRDGAAE